MHPRLSRFPSSVAEREALIVEIERKAEVFRKSGECVRWLQNACPVIRESVAGVNGPLLEHLAHLVGHADHECVDLFRDGKPGQAICIHVASLCSVAGACIYSDELAPPWWKCRESNEELLRSLREDETSAELHKLTLADAGKGRMSKPCEASRVNLDRVCRALSCRLHSGSSCSSFRFYSFRGSALFRALVLTVSRK